MHILYSLKTCGVMNAIMPTGNDWEGNILSLFRTFYVNCIKYMMRNLPERAKMLTG